MNFSQQNPINIRVLQADNLDYYLATVQTATHYYPFGWELVGMQYGAGYRYGFNGKEKDGETKTTDFGARFYDERSGRWWGVEPLAEKYPGLSTYCFAGDNPISFIDEEGLFKMRPEDQKKYPRLKRLLERDIHKLLRDTKVMEAYMLYSGANEASVREAFEWGKGALIKISSPDEEPFMKGNRGFVSPPDSKEPFVIHLDKESILEFENIIRGKKHSKVDGIKDIEEVKGRKASTIDIYHYSITSLVIHEQNHVFEYQLKGQADYNYDINNEDSGHQVEKHIFNQKTGSTFNTNIGDHKYMLPFYKKIMQNKTSPEMLRSKQFKNKFKNN